MAKGKIVRYETIVTAVDVPRQDKLYWHIGTPKGITCRLEKIGEYVGQDLIMYKLQQFGFKGREYN